MTFRFEDLQGSQAVDINQLFGVFTGYGLVEGGDPTVGARPFAVDVLDARTYVDGTEVETDATSFDLREYAVQDEARKVVIYIGADAALHIEAGDPAEPKPRGRTRFDTYEPSPPSLEDVSGVAVAEVWIGANAQNITDDDIRDRRLNSRIASAAVSTTSLGTQQFIDGSGRALEALVDLENAVTEERVTGVINDDEEHGEDSHHTYYGGTHTGLTDVASADHHGEYTATESQDAVRGAVDVSEFVIEGGITPGHHLAQDSNAPTWNSPPMAEAPVLQTGTVTHTGGSSTTTTISGITPSQGAYLEIGVNLGVETSPSWSGDYAFSVGTVRQWDDGDGAINAEIDITWDTDPGTDNDLELRYFVYEMTPSIVSEVYTDENAVNAVSGSDISPDAIDPTSEFNFLGISELIVESDEVYTIPDGKTENYESTVVKSGGELVQDPGSVLETKGIELPGSSTGSITIAKDDAGVFGEFVHDGTDWFGPYYTGLSSLDELTIDTDKSWNGYTINNLGGPDGTTDVIREGDIDNHTDVSNAHHVQTESSDIDHTGISNVTPDDHHPRYDDSESREAVGVRTGTVPITATTIPDGDSITVHRAISDGERLHLNRGVLYDENHEIPSGLSLVVEDMDTDTQLYSQTTRYQSGALMSHDGPATMRFRIENFTGSASAVGATTMYYLEAL